MITKILFTLGVIVACMWLLSARAKPQLRTIRNPVDERRKKLLRNAAFAFMAVMVLAAGLMIYLELDDRNAVVTVHVINSQSGAVKSYRAQKSAIRGDGFTTLEGVQVFVAGIERIEIEAPE
jgi:Ni,Fe-hydrogenase I cytochrome b subunit